MEHSTYQILFDGKSVELTTPEFDKIISILAEEIGNVEKQAEQENENYNRYVQLQKEQDDLIFIERKLREIQQ